MNFASWVILGIVLVVVGLAVRSVFFKKGSACSGCSQADTCHGDGDQKADELIELSLGCSPSVCASCSMDCKRD